MRILLAEDNPVTGHTLAELLRRRGHEVEWSANGHAALAKSKVWTPDVLVADLILGDLNGVELVGMIHASRAEMERLPAVLITAAKGAGPMMVLPVLYKPFNVEDLLAEIEALFAKNKPPEVKNG